MTPYAALLRMAVVLLLATPTTADPVRRDIRAELADGRTLHFACSGAGAPTVLLESGFAGSSDAWYKVQPVLARKTRVCSYDRAGYGSSDPGPMPRDGAAIAKDLSAGLRAAGIPGPYVMVGHSAGALYVQIFRRERPKDVVGMVLVDPSVAHQDWRFADLGGAGSLDPLRARAARCVAALEARLSPPDPAAFTICLNGPPHGPGAVSALTFWRSEVAELDTMWTATSDEVPVTADALGALPLVVLTAGAEAPLDPGQARWKALHQELAARSTKGVERSVPGSSHLIMIDQPDAVITAVQEVIAQARRQ